ncbi:hypothetical protein OG809_34015 [Kribbella soli]
MSVDDDTRLREATVDPQLTRGDSTCSRRLPETMRAVSFHAQQRRALWSTEPESSFCIWARRFFRGLVVAVPQLTATSTIRAWIAPNRSPETVVNWQNSFPSDDVHAVTARYGVPFRTWDQYTAEARPAQVRPVAQLYSFGGARTLAVRVQVPAFLKRLLAYMPGAISRERMSAPVARRPGGGVVSQPPTFVPDVWAALPDNMPEAGVPDGDLTAAPQKDAEALFTHSQPERFGQLKDWQVYTGNDDERRAIAAVTWDGVGDTTLDQTYTLTLRRTLSPRTEHNDGKWLPSDDSSDWPSDDRGNEGDTSMMTYGMIASSRGAFGLCSCALVKRKLNVTPDVRSRWHAGAAPCCR